MFFLIFLVIRWVVCFIPLGVYSLCVFLMEVYARIEALFLFVLKVGADLLCRFCYRFGVDSRVCSWEYEAFAKKCM